MAEPVSIIGASGALGFALSIRLGIAGVAVTLGSRDSDRAQETLDRAQAAVPSGTFVAADNAHAAQANELLFLCVPFRNQSETLTNLKGVLRPGQIVVDATVPLAAAVSGKATRMLGVWQGSAAEQAQEMVPEGVAVISALHTVGAPTFGNLSHPVDEDVLVAGNTRADKKRVADVLDQIDGLRCVDVGRLEMARICESMTALLISANVRHKAHLGVKLTGLPADLWPPLKKQG